MGLPNLRFRPGYSLVRGLVQLFPNMFEKPRPGLFNTDMGGWETFGAWTFFQPRRGVESFQTLNRGVKFCTCLTGKYFNIIIGCYPEAKQKYDFFCVCPSQMNFFIFFKRIQKLFGWEINASGSHFKCFILSMISLYFAYRLTSWTPSFTLHSMLGTVH